MSKKSIDLTDIKENDLDKTSSFTDLMSRSERKQKRIEKNETDINDIEEMVEEKKRNTKDLTIELEKAKSNYKKEISEDDELSNTQILEITRQMKYNFEENKKINVDNKKKGVSILNIIGEINLLCIGYYIYLLVFTNYQDDKISYMISGGIIILLVLIFGLSVVTSKKVSKFFNILNVLIILSFVVFNIYTLLH